MHSCFEPYTSIVCDSDWGITQLGVIGCPWCSYFRSWDFLSTNIVEGICHMFRRDAVSALCIDVEGTLKDVQFCCGRKDNSERCTSPVWGHCYDEGSLS